MPAPIVVGIDGSVYAWRALDWAGDHAARHRAPVRLVHGSHALVRDLTVPQEAYERVAAERRDLVDEARQYALTAHPELEITTRLVAGDPGHALVEESDGAALLVVGSRGLGGLDRLLLGSVGLYTAAHARCPVLLVPQGAPDPADAPAEIVVGIEGRHPEDRQIGWAFEEATSRKARILALHAFGGEFGSPHQRIVEDMELSEALAGWPARYPDVQVNPVVSHHTPSQALVVASESAALIVVGAHRRRHGRIGMALGRVNHAVLHHSRCPVVVVPAAEDFGE